MSTRCFGSMGCTIVVAGAGSGAFHRIVCLFEARDRIFSRFRPDSELNRVNVARRSVVPVSAEFARATARAVAAARRTSGLVDLTVGGALVAAGYDVDFDQLAADPAPPARPAPCDWRTVVVGDRVLRRPPGTKLDLNGVVKAMAVDDAVRLLDGPGFVSAGGDLAARGTPVEVSLGGRARITLERGGIATSGTTTRRWLRAREVQHHLIDPRTASPARSPWTEVTAVGRTCTAADVAAKAGFLLGDDGPEWLDRNGVAARFTRADSAVVENRRWRRSLGRDPEWR